MLSILNHLAENFDLPILDWLASNVYCGFLDFLMPLITVLGDAGIFWIALAIIAASFWRCTTA